LVIRKLALHHRGQSIGIKKTKKFTPEKRVEYLLEEGSLQSLTEGKKLHQAHIKYQWDFYSELAYQRNLIQDQLIASIQESCITSYKIESWQRVTRWKYSGHPFSTVGSIVSWGGRFNIGKDISQGGTLKTFQALYLAQSQATAQVEGLGSGTAKSPLSIEDIALANKSSFVCVSVSGILDRVIDLTDKTALVTFAKLISKFKVPQSILDSAARLNIPLPTLIKSPGPLLKSLLIDNWRKEPAQFDIPANGQIFGHLVYLAGIDSIVYPSSKTGERCLAVFPSNFDGRNSYLRLDDEPPEKWTPRVISSENFTLCEKTSDELQLLG